MDSTVNEQAVVISTRGLTKRFGDTVALQSLDLDVEAGSIFGFLGPNGAGKSTAIRLLMGLLRPTAGSAQVLGFDVDRNSREVHARVGYLPGDFAPYLHSNASQYLGYLADLRGSGHDSIDELAERFELKVEKRIGELSHGNRQKVGLIQALMHDPELIILDEPTQGLDPLMQRVFLRILEERRSAGSTVLLSSHILSEVEMIADRVAIIREGRLATITDVEDLRERTRRRVTIRLTNDTAPPLDELRQVDNVVSVGGSAPTFDIVVEGSMEQMLATVAPWGIERIVSNDVDLEGVFLQFYEEQHP